MLQFEKLYTDKITAYNIPYTKYRNPLKSGHTPVLSISTEKILRLIFLRIINGSKKENNKRGNSKVAN